MMRVTLYGKPNCHLCELAKADLLDLQKEGGFVLEQRDIQDPNLADQEQIYQKYRYLIPVVDIEDGPLLYAPLSYASLRQALLPNKVAR